MAWKLDRRLAFRNFSGYKASENDESGLDKFRSHRQTTRPPTGRRYKRCACLGCDIKQVGAYTKDSCMQHPLEEPVEEWQSKRRPTDIAIPDNTQEMLIKKWSYRTLNERTDKLKINQSRFISFTIKSWTSAGPRFAPSSSASDDICVEAKEGAFYYIVTITTVRQVLILLHGFDWIKCQNSCGGQSTFVARKWR